jgi:hypothetical protein
MGDFTSLQTQINQDKEGFLAHLQRIEILTSWASIASQLMGRFKTSKDSKLILDMFLH